MDVKSNWWIPHLILALAIPIFFLLVAIAEGIDMLVGFSVGVSFFANGVLITYLVLAFVALYGYDVEARRLRDAGSDWVPRPWLWAILHFVLTPLVAPVLYLVLRWRKVGLPLGDIPRGVRSLFRAGA